MHISVIFICSYLCLHR